MNPYSISYHIYFMYVCIYRERESHMFVASDRSTELKLCGFTSFDVILCSGFGFVSHFAYCS